MAGDPCDHPVTGARAVQIRWSDRAAQLQPPVRGVHPGAAALYLHRPKECSDAALDYFLHRARPAIRRIAGDLHPQAVSVHHAAHLRRAQEDTLLEAFHAQETVAGAIRTHRTFDDGPGLEVAAGRALTRRDAAALPRAWLAAGGLAARDAGAARAGARSAAAAPPELSPVSLQLTAPDPMRTFRGLPHLPGWRNW